jgi:uncharacterized membrane protein YbaN (DUF454 family)
MNKRIKRIFVLCLGWGFVVLGFIGLFLPILQGILFLLVGLFLLSAEYAWARKIFDKLQQRYPNLYEKVRHWKLKFIKHEDQEREDKHAG